MISSLIPQRANGRAAEASPTSRIGYVVKRYPRFSETFIVSEILAHEAAGAEIEIFSLRPTIDSHFQEAISRVRAPVHHLNSDLRSGTDLWAGLAALSQSRPAAWQVLSRERATDARDIMQAVELARLALARGITHLHAHFATVSTTVARLAALLTGLSYSFTAHAKDIYHEEVSSADLRRKLADASTVVTVSDFNYAHLKYTYGAAADRVRRVYNGIELGRFRYRSPKERPPVIIAVGRLVPKKGFDELLHACAQLARAGVSFECRIVGSGPEEERLRGLRAELELEQQVELLGPRPQTEVQRLVQEAAVFAAPCVVADDGDRDGLPTVLLEAMALGTPCVATDVTGISEVVRQDTGVLLPERRADLLAGALARLLADAAQRVRLARGARALVQTEFDNQRNAAELRRLFSASALLPMSVAV